MTYLDLNIHQRINAKGNGTFLYYRFADPTWNMGTGKVSGFLIKRMLKRSIDHFVHRDGMMVRRDVYREPKNAGREPIY